MEQVVSNVKISVRSLMFLILVVALVVNSVLLYEDATRQVTVAEKKQAEVDRLLMILSVFDGKRALLKHENDLLTDEIESLRYAIQTAKSALPPLIRENSQIVPRDNVVVSTRSIPVVPSREPAPGPPRFQSDRIHRQFRVHVSQDENVWAQIWFVDRIRTGKKLPESQSIKLPTGGSVVDIQVKFEPVQDENYRAPRPLWLVVQVDDLPTLKHTFPVPKRGYVYDLMDDDFFELQGQKDYGRNEALPSLFSLTPVHGMPTAEVRLTTRDNDE